MFSHSGTWDAETGPLVEVGLFSGPTGWQSPQEIPRFRALIDTGAEETCVSRTATASLGIRDSPIGLPLSGFALRSGTAERLRDAPGVFHNSYRDPDTGDGGGRDQDRLSRLGCPVGPRRSVPCHVHDGLRGPVRRWPSPMIVWTTPYGAASVEGLGWKSWHIFLMSVFTARCLRIGVSPGAGYPELGLP